MRSKDGKAPRPKHHYYFPIDSVTDAGEYAAMKRRLHSIVPVFDANALDAARFFFGAESPEVEFFDGNRNLTEFLNQAVQPLAGKSENVIPQGGRNNHLSKFAGKVLKKYGDDDKRAYQAFMDEAAKCSPPLDNSELSAIWNSARGFLRKKVEQQPDYIPPAEFDWQSKLLRNDKGKLLSSTGNLELIFANDTRVTAFAFNELSGHIEKTGKLPWAARGKAWSDCDDTQMKSWLAHNYTSWSEANFNNTLLKIADDRAFHPIRDYLSSLSAWDFILRSDRLLVDTLGAADTPYVHAVTRKMLVGAITRIFTPGAKFDYMCVLVGPQGVGKSTLIFRLGGDWYTDSLRISDMQDPKRAAEKLQGNFII
jgi:hypothetical protein